MAMAAIHAVWAIHLKVDQIISGTAINFLALGITGYIFIDKYGDSGTPGNVAGLRDSRRAPPLPENWYFVGPIIGQLQPDDLAVVRTCSSGRTSSSSGHRTACACARSASIPGAADTVGISVTKSVTWQ